MKVIKFGGTSVGNADRINSVASIVANTPGPKILVLSAMSGITNTLVEICELIKVGKKVEADTLTNSIRLKYTTEVIPQLFGDNQSLINRAQSAVLPIIKSIEEQPCDETFTHINEKHILACGEKMSTRVMAIVMEHYQHLSPILLDALKFMKIDHGNRPDTTEIRKRLTPLIAAHPNNEALFITEGYICTNAFDEIDNLRRGGSDYTATLIGEAIRANEIQIWTDIDGLHNNDPRIVSMTTPVRRLNFGEAAELARFGAKILHPTCIEPARRENIPVRLLYTYDPKAPGTLISSISSRVMIKAVSGKDDISLITLSNKLNNIIRPSMSEVLNHLSELEHRHHLVIDIANISSDIITLAVENESKVDQFCQEASEWFDIERQDHMVIIAVVGDMNWDRTGYESLILSALNDIPIRLIAYGNSNYGIDFVISKDYKAKAMIALSDNIFIPSSIEQPEIG